MVSGSLGYSRWKGFEVKQSHVAFTITSMHIDPSEVTNRLSITPSKVWYVGQLIHPAAGIRYKHNGWSIDDGILYEHIGPPDIGQQAHELVERLFMNEKALLTLCSLCHFELACVVYCTRDESVPSVHFTASTLQKLGLVQAEIDVDIYVA